MGRARFFIETAQLEAENILLSGSQADHAAARRLKTGIEVSLFDGQGGEALARVEGWSKKGTRLKIIKHLEAGPKPLVKVTLIVGLIRAERFRLLIEKAVELGVTEIRPLICEYSQPPRTHKPEKLKRAAIEALKQCGRSFLPTIHSPDGLVDILDAIEPIKSKMVLDLTGEPLGGVNPATTGETALLIGPEGGLSASEIDQARRAGFKAVSLSRAILRTETAALAGLAIIQAAAKVETG